MPKIVGVLTGAFHCHDIFLISGWYINQDTHANDPKMFAQLIEPCELITRTEAEEIMGEKIKVISRYAMICAA